jgi:hypothetical protein
MVIDVSDTRYITISQPGYINRILEKFDVDLTKQASIPYPVTRPQKVDETPVDQIDYLSRVGALNFLAQMSRPDLLYAMSRAAQQCSKPTQYDLECVNQIFHYVNCTKHLTLRFTVDTDFQLQCHVDASHNYYPDGKGHFGYSFSLGRGNGSFLAKSGKLKLQTLSSTESEYFALCEAVRDALWLRQLLVDLGFPQTEPIIFHEDNNSCIQQVISGGNHKATKHINPKFHFVKDHVREGIVHLQFCPTTDQIADLLTKPLGVQSHTKFRNLLLCHTVVFITFPLDSV